MIQTSEVLIDRCASLRAGLRRAGHALSQKIHEADRWIAATAIALGLELVAGDGISRASPGSTSIASDAEPTGTAPLSGGAGEEGRNDVGGVPIQRDAGAVVAHRGARIGV